MRATDVLSEDHLRVRELFLQLEQSAGGEERQALLDQVADELELHSQVEEELFYPAISKASARVEDARTSHQHVRRLLAAVQGLDPGGEEFLAAFRTLKSAVLSHVTEEEGAMFFEAARLGAARLERLGRKIQQRQATLKTARLQRSERKVKQAARRIV